MPRTLECRLHHGRGVRDPDLPAALPADFARRLHIDRAAHPDVVLATLVWQVRTAIARVPLSTAHRRVFTAAFNLDRDPRMTATATRKERFVLLRAAGGPAPDTANRYCSKDIGPVTDLLRNGRFAPPPAEALAREAAQEAGYRTRHARPPALSEADFARVVAERGPGAGAAVKSGLVHFAVSERGLMVVRRTAGIGDVACVFTSAELLAQYQRATGAPESDRRTRAPGAKLLQRLVQDGSLGLAVNPLGGAGAEAGHAWTAEELMAL